MPQAGPTQLEKSFSSSPFSAVIFAPSTRALARPLRPLRHGLRAIAPKDFILVRIVETDFIDILWYYVVDSLVLCGFLVLYFLMVVFDDTVGFQARFEGSAAIRFAIAAQQDQGAGVNMDMSLPMFGFMIALQFASLDCRNHCGIVGAVALLQIRKEGVSRTETANIVRKRYAVRN